MEDGRLSQARLFSKGMDHVTEAVYPSGCCDKR